MPSTVAPDGRVCAHGETAVCSKARTGFLSTCVPSDVADAFECGLPFRIVPFMVSSRGVRLDIHPCWVPPGTVRPCLLLFLLTSANRKLLETLTREGLKASTTTRPPRTSQRVIGEMRKLLRHLRRGESCSWRRIGDTDRPYRHSEWAGLPHFGRFCPHTSAIRHGARSAAILSFDRL